ncbi:MAG TPA: glycosyltransferase family 39 protein [Planctomycetota bacterium]
MKNATRLFYCALIFSLVFHVLHGLLLPIVVPYEGLNCLQLARVIGTNQFTSAYDFTQAPAYPLALKISLALFGQNAWAAQLPNFVFGFSGIVLLAFTIKRLGYASAAAACAVFLTLYPTFIAYEHTLLPEVATFFSLSLITFALLWLTNKLWLRTLAVAASLAVAYYFCERLQYIAPVIALVNGISLLPLRLPGEEVSGLGRKPWARVVAHTLAACAIPFLLAWPWMKMQARYERPWTVGMRMNDSDISRNLLLYGLLKQAVLPDDDPVIGQSATRYREAIKECSSGSVLNVSGLTPQAMAQFEWDVLAQHASEGRAIFFRTVKDHTSRYAAGVERSLLFLSGLHGIDDENGLYVSDVIKDADAGAKIYGIDHPLFAEAKSRFVQNTQRTLLSKTLTQLTSIYDILLVAAAGVSALGLIAGFYRLDVRLVAFTAVPVALILLHALMLLSIHRYAVPAWPILLANLIMVPVLLWRPRVVDPDTVLVEVPGAYAAS